MKSRRCPSGVTTRYGQGCERKRGALTRVTVRERHGPRGYRRGGGRRRGRRLWRAPAGFHRWRRRTSSTTRRGSIRVRKSRAPPRVTLVAGHGLGRGGGGGDGVGVDARHDSVAARSGQGKWGLATPFRLAAGPAPVGKEGGDNHSARASHQQPYTDRYAAYAHQSAPARPSIGGRRQE